MKQAPVLLVPPMALHVYKVYMYMCMCMFTHYSARGASSRMKFILGPVPTEADYATERRKGWDGSNLQWRIQEYKSRGGGGGRAARVSVGGGGPAGLLGGGGEDNTICCA